MYSKLSTQAIVLKVDDVGERDVLLSLFTREFGFVYAKATGVRTQSSRLRFTLQSMTLCFVSLVHGKTGWILTNASFVKSYYFDCESFEQRQTISKIISLIKRLYIGEEAHLDLFDFLKSHFDMLCFENFTIEQAKHLEIFIVFKMLEKLGYVENSEIVKPLLKADEYTVKIKEYVKEFQKQITPFINSAIRASGL